VSVSRKVLFYEDFQNILLILTIEQQLLICFLTRLKVTNVDQHRASE